MLVWHGYEDWIGPWMGHALGTEFHPPFVTIGFSHDGETLAGGALFNGWNGANMDITIAGPGCMTRQAIETVYRYVFDQARAERMTARTARNNARMKKLLPRLGFKFESIARHWYGPDDDAIVYALFRDPAMRWLQRRTEDARDHI